VQAQVDDSAVSERTGARDCRG